MKYLAINELPLLRSITSFIRINNYYKISNKDRITVLNHSKYCIRFPCKGLTKYSLVGGTDTKLTKRNDW